MTTKVQLRREIAEQRRALDPAWISTASGVIAERLQKLDEFKKAGTVAIYKAIEGEVDLEDLFPACWNTVKHTCIPVFNYDIGAYEMAEITSQTRYETGHYGILEPLSAPLVPCREIDLMVLPGVAFDTSGNRLGRGGGYYDRLLDGFNGYSVAVAFDFQVYPQIPCDSRDIPVDILVTETKIMKVQNEH